MTKHKFIVKPGNVISKNDGDNHYISFEQLVKLYGAQPRDCIDSSKVTNKRFDWNHITLSPKEDGNYNLASNIDEQIENVYKRIAEHDGITETMNAYNNMSFIDRMWIAIFGYTV